MTDEAADNKKKTNGPTIRWDDSKMRSVYANVCNVSSTREEVTLLFGTNQAWRSGQKEVAIELTDRVIVSPFAAKRLSLLLNGVVAEYEKRFGALDEAEKK
ncbi:DUF3467 domain-containing protein [Psychromonas sp. MB-3u-54]|uniref:DUF3467 domain-containing protein n=1 Tax=Psychromonas sp. MB-3u-54 TaxID=2058319 RepID=UPI000C327A2E|nr:DUF3467 domain-containing protein [Psychromonas sp. MB-3u-54]PKH01420.1 DUF3467 domain-containing protein [Psychromonas sp. MB-3u-54]